ncbi:3-oxoacyl-[acyl-carrier-protein] reductase FabG [Candidatus Mikella endobia]|uniref:3-oxoacyl-[acyl-carrier-protein] reductase n=1 Tax=Candidatus Mikella endobia TaxID=1778264 RepID=A0A143WQS7_9ENTR|nr:3-oxoacyl-ACP reductase FabG [Candidatus Mikella endobia]CUX96060.1 3-oxoacyl-[acyl-carrier-protein] reductase FabG [Candidatus Mikella endobia]
MNFKGKVVLVTGASRGIGRAIAEKFVNNGATVIGTATNKISVAVVSDYLGNSGKGMELDISNNTVIKQFLENMRAEFGDADILINNAGITHDNLLMCMKENEWQYLIDTNLTSVFRMSKAVIKTMIKKNYGRIITIGSVVGSVGNVGQGNYAAAKAGLIGFSKSLAREVASRGITVNVVAPGFIDTDMTKKFTNKKLSGILSQIPVNRLGYPKEIANAVTFLASDEAEYITGETIHVNGGMYMP